jgi:hypothetical protein
MDFRIPDYHRLFARFRYKMMPKMFANGCFWMGDIRPDRTILLEKEKNPCFWPWGYDACHTRVEKMPKASSTFGRVLHRRAPTWNPGCQIGRCQTLRARRGRDQKKVIFSCQTGPKFSDGNISITPQIRVMIFPVFVQKMMYFVHRTHDLGFKPFVCPNPAKMKSKNFLLDTV